MFVLGKKRKKKNRNFEKVHQVNCARHNRKISHHDSTKYTNLNCFEARFYVISSENWLDLRPLWNHNFISSRVFMLELLIRILSPSCSLTRSSKVKWRKNNVHIQPQDKCSFSHVHRANSSFCFYLEKIAKKTWPTFPTHDRVGRRNYFAYLR